MAHCVFPETANRLLEDMNKLFAKQITIRMDGGEGVSKTQVVGLYGGTKTGEIESIGHSFENFKFIYTL